MRYQSGVLLAVIVASSLVLWQSLTGVSLENKPAVLGATAATFVHENYPFNWSLFFSAVEKNQEKTSLAYPLIIQGGVVPHHLLPAELLTDFYARLAHQEVKTVIIIGPNHAEAGNYWALTSSGAWKTQKRTVQPNLAVVAALQKKGVLQEDAAAVVNDQSILTQIPFVGEFLPAAQVVPIILSAHTSMEEVDKLVAALQEVKDDQTVILASVDFSHYLSNQKAQEKDLQTRALMEERSYEQLLSLAGNADYLDSPASVVTVLKLMQLLKSDKMEILQNTNSGILQRNDSDPSTSYFEIVFTKHQ